MLKNNKTDIKSTKMAPGFKKEIDRAHISMWSHQIGDPADNGYNMFDGPQAESEHMNRPLIKATSRIATKGEDFHWMANAAYNRSK